MPRKGRLTAAGKATYDRVHNAVSEKAADKGAGLTTAERKAERADAGAGSS